MASQNRAGRSRRDDPGGVRPLGCGYSEFGSFKYMVAIFALYFVFTLLAIGVPAAEGPPAVTEFGCYALFNVLLFAAFVACVTECNTTIVDPEYPVCKRATGAKASVAFAFLTWAARASPRCSRSRSGGTRGTRACRGSLQLRLHAGAGERRDHADVRVNTCGASRGVFRRERY